MIRLVSLRTINVCLNFFFLVLVLEVPRNEDLTAKGKGTTFHLSTIFSRGYLYNWPQIRLATWLGL